MSKPAAMQTLDLVAARIESPLLGTEKLRVLLAFPYASPEMSMADWNEPARHTTTFSRTGKNCADFARKLDETEYHAGLQWSGAEFSRRAEHEFVLGGTSGNVLEFVCLFSAEAFSGELPPFAQVKSSSERGWENFWSDGGAVDLSGSTDPRAAELERRIVLSLYNTAIHCAGSLPSAETGLLFNSWYGKFHLEMHWWHSVHFTAWNRFSYFERSLAIYERILPLAHETAQRQGYQRRALAENDWPGWPRFAVVHRAAVDLATATSDLLRGTLLPRKAIEKDAGTLARDCF